MPSGLVRELPSIKNQVSRKVVFGHGIKSKGDWRMNAKKVIIDCDPGIDDALALMLALRSPELEILGITVVSGNVPAKKGAANAQKVLHWMNQPDIPVYLGEELPLVRPYVDAMDTHGEDGLGESHYPEITNGTINTDGVGFLGVSGKKFAVEVDEREEAILAELPGNNCGGCGYAGCSGLAAAIVKGEAEVGGCPVGGAPVAEKIGAIMGQSAGSQERKVAFVKCAGTCENASKVYEYYGIKDCTMANLMQDGGQKGCSYGCLGFGSCVKACPFDAIHVENGIAVVDKEACKACGKCIEACPKKLIELIPYKQKTFVQCSSHDKGKALMSVCKVGCIGCKLCERSCEAGAITVLNGLAHIDADKCTNCGVCAEKCPRKIIIPRQTAE